MTKPLTANHHPDFNKISNAQTRHWFGPNMAKAVGNLGGFVARAMSGGSSRRRDGVFQLAEHGA